MNDTQKAFLAQALIIVECAYRNEYTDYVTRYGIRAAEEIVGEATCTAKAFPFALRTENELCSLFNATGTWKPGDGQEAQFRRNCRKVIAFLLGPKPLPSWAA